MGFGVYFVMRIRFLAILFFVALTVASVHSYDYQLQAEPKSVLAKIDRWVLDETAAKGQAEFLVVLADQADLSGAEKLRTKEEKGWYVYRTLYDKAQATQKPLLNWLRSRGIEHRSFYIVNMIWVKGNLDLALTLATRPDVGRIAGNPVIHNELPKSSLASDKGEPIAPYALSSGVSYSRAPEVWAMGYNRQGMVVGTADTGYQWDHPALKPHYRGWNGVAASHDYNWHDSIHSSAGPCPGDSPQPCYDLTHGTHTIGTAIGDDGGTNQIGMASGARFIGCRNMDQGFGTPTTYAECFQFFLAPYPVNGSPAQGDPTKAPDVTTHSWVCLFSEGCDNLNPGTLLPIQQAIQANRAAGIVTVVAAGNSGSGCSTVRDAPSFFSEVFSVGALNTGLDEIASFSSRGPVTVDGSNRQKPDIAARGTNILSSVPVNDYASAGWSGTSMATPHVAGAVALMLSAQPSLRGKVSTIEAILKDSAVHIDSAFCSSSGNWPNNVFGYGRLDAKAAADMALTTFSPQSSAFSAAGTDGSLNISAPAGVNWTATTNDSWITIVDGSGTGNGTVDFIVRDNPNQQLRIGKITVAHRDFTVRQQGFGQTGCTYAVTPKFQSFPSAGGAGSTTVVTTEECIWTATSNAGWIKITSDNGGLGNGPLTFTVDPNNSGASRKGTINISGTLFSVKQKFP